MSYIKSYASSLSKPVNISGLDLAVDAFRFNTSLQFCLMDGILLDPTSSQATFNPLC